MCQPTCQLTVGNQLKASRTVTDSWPARWPKPVKYKNLTTNHLIEHAKRGISLLILHSRSCILVTAHISKGLLNGQSFVNSKLLELKIPFPLYVICRASHEHTLQNQQERLAHLHSLRNKPKIQVWVMKMHIHIYICCRITRQCSTAVLNAQIDKQKGFFLFHFFYFEKQKGDEHKKNHQLKDNYSCTVCDEDDGDEGVYGKLSSTQRCS